jgi:hypothetical protein
MEVRLGSLHMVRAWTTRLAETLRAMAWPASLRLSALGMMTRGECANRAPGLRHGTSERAPVTPAGDGRRELGLDWFLVVVDEYARRKQNERWISCPLPIEAQGEGGYVSGEAEKR